MLARLLGTRPGPTRKSSGERLGFQQSFSKKSPFFSPSRLPFLVVNPAKEVYERRKRESNGATTMVTFRHNGSACLMLVSRLTEWHENRQFPLELPRAQNRKEIEEKKNRKEGKSPGTGVVWGVCKCFWRGGGAPFGFWDGQKTPSPLPTACRTFIIKGCRALFHALECSPRRVKSPPVHSAFGARSAAF